MTPKFIYFDMGNVLLHFSHDRQAEQIGAVAGLPAAQVKQLLYEDQHGLHWLAERGEAPREQFFARFCKSTATQPVCAAFEQASNDIFWVNASIVPVVTQLRAAGFRLGVLSNTTEPHWDFCLRRFRLLELFHVYALSFALGAMKPDSAVYAKATELAGVAPSEIFFTDDRADNVAAAKDAGWEAVLFESAEKLSVDLRSRGVVTNY